MHTVTSFHASDVDPDQLSGIIADYLALERTRFLRRLFVKRFALLAVILGGASLLWLTAFAFWFCLALCMAAPACVWLAELECEQRLTRRLEEVPAETRTLGRSQNQVGQS